MLDTTCHDSDERIVSKMSAPSILAKGCSLSDSTRLVYGAVTLEEGRKLAQGQTFARITWIGFH